MPFDRRLHRLHDEALASSTDAIGAVPVDRWHSRPPAERIAHAYFGAMSPRQTLVLLTGHTRHHAEGLKMRSRSDS